MRTKLVAGNWKMNLTAKEAVAVVESFVEMVASRNDIDVVLCPSAIVIPKVRELLRNTHIKIGGQDVFWQESGAFTGQISAAMLADAGADYCIVGHSETRGRFGKLETPESTVPFFAETDETVNLKIKRLLFHAITPILCVGETLAEREAEQTEAVIEKQLVAALEGVDPSELASFVVAYEPVWAIGTGKTCASDEANRVCGFIREVLAKTVEPEVVEHIRVLYGGSVKGANSYELFSQPFIDGGLVGGSSLDPGEFSRIVSNA